jgi:hypothetical protein
MARRTVFDMRGFSIGVRAVWGSKGRSTPDGQFCSACDRLPIANSTSSDNPVTPYIGSGDQELSLQAARGMERALHCPAELRTASDARNRGDKGYRWRARLRAPPGAGIPPGHLEGTVDGLFTTKPPGLGTGLGLSISRGIIADDIDETGEPATPEPPAG